MVKFSTETVILREASALKLLQAETMADVAAAIGCERNFLFTSLLNEERYEAYFIPKKKKGLRLIEAPNAEIKKIQSRLNELLQIIYNNIKPDCVHGFILHTNASQPVCNIVTNAKPHVGKRYLLNMDLEDFFHSVSVKRVKEIFTSYPFYRNNDVASFLAAITTFNDRLPMGAPTSPTLGNFACFLLDRQLKLYADKNDFTYTRYADDLSFSSNKAIQPNNLTDLNNIIEGYGFRVNPSKVRLQTGKGAQRVTGLKVNLKVNVSRSYVRTLRAMLHNWETKGLIAASKENRSKEHFINVLQGKLNFLKMVRGENDELYRKFKQKAERMMNY